MNSCYSLKAEVFQGIFHNDICSLRDLLKLSLWNCLRVCFLLDHVLVLANLTMISCMILRELMQWHFWETVALIFLSCIFFPTLLHSWKFSLHINRGKISFQTWWPYPNTVKMAGKEDGEEVWRWHSLYPTTSHPQHYWSIVSLGVVLAPAAPA